jgi:ATP-dependent exoDNAse (exonuclease V) alpha subunit
MHKFLHRLLATDRVLLVGDVRQHQAVDADRVQFTASDREHHIANRDLGTIGWIDKRGQAQIRLDTGRTVAMTLKDHPHLDYGYAVTSHSSQGQTADRVLVHIDTDRAGEQLVNRRLAYVAVSRGRLDAHIYTNDTAHLAQALNRYGGHRSAMEPSPNPAAPSESLETSLQGQAVQQTIAQGLSR